MQILAIVNRYPEPFKPYYDVQFAQWVREGHGLSVLSRGGVREPLNEKVRAYSLADCTRHYPATLRNCPQSLFASVPAVARNPRRAMGLAGQAFARKVGLRESVVLAIRGLVLAGEHPDIVLIHGMGPAVDFRWLSDAFADVPLAIYYHGGEVPSAPARDPARVRDAFRAADSVFTNTEFSRNHAIGRGAPPDRTHIVPVGFDLDDFQPPSPREYRRGGTLRLLSAGRMSEEKGFAYAVEALRILVHERGITRIHYSLTGEGPYRPSLEDLVRDHDLEEHVTFLGTLSTEQVLEEMQSTDVLLLPSVTVGNWVENQATAVQEAMLMKAIVVVSRTGGVPESTAPAFHPLIAEERDSQGLANSIERVYRMDDADLRASGEEGREFVLRGYDIRSLNRQLLDTVAKDHALLRNPPS